MKDDWLELIYQDLDGVTGENEKGRLRELESNAEFRKLYQQTEDMFKALSETESVRIPDGLQQRILNSVRLREPGHSEGHIWLRYAAVLLLGALLGAALSLFRPEATNVARQVVGTMMAGERPAVEGQPSPLRLEEAGVVAEFRLSRADDDTVRLDLRVQVDSATTIAILPSAGTRVVGLSAASLDGMRGQESGLRIHCEESGQYGLLVAAEGGGHLDIGFYRGAQRVTARRIPLN